MAKRSRRRKVKAKSKKTPRDWSGFFHFAVLLMLVYGSWQADQWMDSLDESPVVSGPAGALPHIEGANSTYVTVYPDKVIMRDPMGVSSISTSDIEKVTRSFVIVRIKSFDGSSMEIHFAGIGGAKKLEKILKAELS